MNLHRILNRVPCRPALLFLLGLIMALTPIAPLFLTGCVTSPTTGKRMVDVARIANLTGAAAEIGTREYLSLHPDQAAYFVTTREALGSLIAAKDYSPASFTAAIKKLPVNALHGTNVSIYVTLGVLVFDQVAEQLVALDSQQKILPVLYAVYNGMSRAMGLPETPTPVPPPPVIPPPAPPAPPAPPVTPAAGK